MPRASRYAASALFSCAIACLACLLSEGVAHADDTTEAARQAYDRGAAAYDAGDYGLAASELIRADELLPSDVALELALKAAVKGDDARTAITLAARAERRTRSGPLAAAAQAARTKMSGRTGSVTVTCPGRTTCVPRIDGTEVTPGESHVILVGDHKVVIEGTPGPREAYDVRVDPDAVIVIKTKPVAATPIGPPTATPAVPPPSSDRASSSSSSGISPVWFWIGVSATAVLGGAALLSALDTQSKHEDFQARPTPDLQQAGLDAQLRTNLLAGGAGFSGVLTAVVGLVFVRWSSPSPSPPPSALRRSTSDASF